MPTEWKVEGVAPGLPEGARSATGGEPGAAAEVKRWSAGRKKGVVLRLLRGEPVAPAFELVYRHRHLARDGIDRLAAQQAQHAPLLPSRRPPLHLGGRTGLATSRATRSFRQARRNPFHLPLIQHFQPLSLDTVLPQIRVQNNRGRRTEWPVDRWCGYNQTSEG